MGRAAPVAVDSVETLRANRRETSMIHWEWAAGVAVAAFTLGCWFGTTFGVRPRPW